MPTLYIFSGLPGVGKTTLACRLARQWPAMLVRIDTIEQALRDICGMQVEAEGYRLAYRIAGDNLKLGLDVIADSCNPIERTRREWEHVAVTHSASIVNIEVICSDVGQHRHRVEKRTSDITGLQLPSWQAVQNRVYEAWTRDRVVVDTATGSVDECVDRLNRRLALKANPAGESKNT